jgi:hypothetical protein
MALKFNFVADSILGNKAYPAMAKWQARPYTPEWRQFVHHWPNTVPCELHEHCATHDVDYSLESISKLSTSNAFYSVGLGFFNFDIDYFSLMSHEVLSKLNNKEITVLFYYHEGDNPYRIKKRLDYLCQQHNLPANCYKFVSGNTAADDIRRFAWFPDHELLYWHRNQKILPTSIHLNPRSYRFTILNRTHKWWRATVMTDLQRAGILDHSQWSYNTDLTVGDDLEDNPIEIDTLNLRDHVHQFIANGPYVCDDLTADQHNDHHLHVPEHFTQSYCHVVIETHFDADQSGGAFLTEKTFKPIKHGQPFVIVGAPGSLSALRKLGYRTFDHAIDNSYDLETNNTRRWQKIRNTIDKINQQNLNDWFASCLDDVCYNQQLFLRAKKDRLNMLFNKLKQK